MNKPNPMTERAHAFRAARRAEGHVEAGVSCVLDPLDVARMLQEAGESDPFLLAAAVLHDLLQTGSATEAELAADFGSETAFIVAEVSDHPQLSVSTRRALRLAAAPQMSRKARLLKLAQLVASVRNLAGPYAPAAWEASHRREFFGWVERFAAAARVPNPTLQAIMLAELEQARLALGAVNANLRVS